MNDNATIAQNIKALREHHNISQVEFAKMMEVTDRAISAWETGIKEPRLKNINKIAEVFNVPPQEIIYGNLETYYQTKNSPTPAAAEARENKQVTREDLLEVLQKLHIIESGSAAISDADLQFLMHIIAVIDDWFSNRG